MIIHSFRYTQFLQESDLKALLDIVSGAYLTGLLRYHTDGCCLGAYLECEYVHRPVGKFYDSDSSDQPFSYNAQLKAIALKKPFQYIRFHCAGQTPPHFAANLDHPVPVQALLDWLTGGYNKGYLKFYWKPAMPAGIKEDERGLEIVLAYEDNDFGEEFATPGVYLLFPRGTKDQEPAEKSRLDGYEAKFSKLPFLEKIIPVPVS